MTEHPVVACYRGLDSADAVALGALLAAAIDEPLVLASAYHYEPAGLSARALPAPDNARRADAATAALRRARTFAGRDVEVRERVIAAAGTADSLAALASDVDACLLVVGRDTEGSVTRSLIQRAPCPVAVAPLGVALPRIGPLERIGIAFDGSPTARWALVAAARLARETGARLELLTAAADPEHAWTALHIAELALKRDVAWEPRPLAGEPAAQLTAASRELDLLVCGSRGRKRAVAALLGSVSGHLIRQAHCPVLVVPPRACRGGDGPLGLPSAAAGA
jgi:nucleotide-binding universal stress UspA family protein